MRLAAVDPHVHLLPAGRMQTLMRWLLRALPDVGITRSGASCPRASRTSCRWAACTPTTPTPRA